MQETRFLLDDSFYATLLGNTTMQASLSVGYDIPRFCYHEKLSIAGNCRMCLLEISYPRSLKPLASCALPVMTGISIYTNTVMVKKAREGVLELLLLNHPLDCPVCDQAGECDLQDETSLFGGDRGRFYESKRAVEDKDCGPIVKTSMNRCIHCTKCVRFCNEICGESSLGTLGRGSDMEVGTYVDESIDSELSGNLPDVCPVGALTSKPYAFKARPWELRSFETVDIIDSLGSHIRVDIRGVEVMRILPSQAEDVNEDWITDRTRFSYDGLKTQRLNSPMVKVSGILIPTAWETAFRISASFLNLFLVKKNSETYLNIFLDYKTSICGIFGDLVDSETLMILNDFFREIGGAQIFFQQDFLISADFRSNYLLNLPLHFIEKIDLCVLIGLNIRLELPLLNLRIRKAFLNNNAMVISYGFITNLTYQYFQQGSTLNSFLNFLNGKSYVSKCLIDANFPVLFVSSSFFKTFSCFSSFEIFKGLLKYSNLFTVSGWVGLNIIDSRISLNSARDLGVTSPNLNNFSRVNSGFLYLLGVEQLNLSVEANSFFFKIFQGHSGDHIALSADVIFPGSSFFEKESLYTTLEGKVQKTKLLMSGPLFSRPDWKIIANFRIFFYTKFTAPSMAVDLTNPYVLRQLAEIDEVRKRLISLSSSFNLPQAAVAYPSHKILQGFFNISDFPRIYRFLFYLNNFFFLNNTKNFFFNNAVTRNSKIMSVCAGRYSTRQSNFWK